jgi:hypothetical protein
MNFKNLSKKKNNNQKNEDRIWQEKKTKEGGIVKQNQFKKWFQTKQIEIKRIGIKFEDKKN